MKRAIVLSGGGTKGAYEVGVWKALGEIGTEYRIVTGTSIGSVNGALMAMGDYSGVERIWTELKESSFINEKPEILPRIRSLVTPNMKAEDYRKLQLISGTVDNTPFQHFIREIIDEERVRSSSVDYGLVTVRARDGNPFLLKKSEIPQGMLAEYIIASSSVYPIFPMHQIGSDFFVDGMYYDNLPIDLAISMGAEELVAVDLHMEPQHPGYASRPYVTYITPSEDLGWILDFDRERIAANMRMGYRDAMRAFGKHRGFVYNFDRDSLRDYERAAEIFNLHCAREEAAIGMSGGSRLRRAGELYLMFRHLEKYAKGKALSKEDYFIRGAEIAAEIFHLDREKVWHMKDLADSVRAGIGTVEEYPDARRFLKDGRLAKKTLQEMRKDRGEAYVTGCLYYALKSGPLPFMAMRGVLAAFPRELAAGLFLYAADGNGV